MAETALAVTVAVAASPERVFAVLTDWDRHHEWMVATRARVTRGDGRGVGSALAAFTGAGPVGFTDTMEITRWEPPHTVEVRHTGRVVRGTGAFRVRPGPGGGAVIRWEERLDLPFGPVGRLGRWVAGPVGAAFLRLSLRRLARLCAADRPGTAAPR
ncbi:MAG: SRPBCC family protein [Actinomycetes bacterium]|nr:MAG: SRPBCC family protein [Actinomycetota bacterium]